MRGRKRLPESIRVPGRMGGPAAVLVVLTLAAVVCKRAAERPVAADDWARYHGRTFTVVRVVDADTLDIEVPDGGKPVTRIRLWGVDAPEVTHGDADTMHFGAESSAFARRALEGRAVHIVLAPHRSRGKYGRLLAYLFFERGGVMFNEQLLEEGMAYADLRFDHPYYERFKRIEARARKADVGLWSKVTLDGMPDWRRRFEHEDLAASAP